ncbi:TetR family transcriptional regulator [Actinocorallia herbida]|uniref:TetR family transcriptional regulator n=1 Tax=Actinocorallia herbida TaxID=58109 RepID=A0A3N1D2W0_9ACTN|nr:TetR/AcrR family transcriptional regulator [Actinocorallia herbida]ROO87875.1 TetR family transcriptional regulator [Actinocorallia herbida]
MAGRPRLTEADKEAVRLRVAEAAVRLFMRQGVEATSVGEIAEAAGISQRTLWRHFATKEDCATPLFTLGIGKFSDHLAQASAEAPLAEVLTDTSWLVATGQTAILFTIDLVRLARDEPSLRAVWARATSEAVPAIATALANRSGRDPEVLEVKVEGAMLAAALDIALRDYAWRNAGERGPALDEMIRTACARALSGLTP